MQVSSALLASSISLFTLTGFQPLHLQLQLHLLGVLPQLSLVLWFLPFLVSGEGRKQGSGGISHSSRNADRVHGRGAQGEQRETAHHSQYRWRWSAWAHTRHHSGGPRGQIAGKTTLRHLGGRGRSLRQFIIETVNCVRV